MADNSKQLPTFEIFIAGMNHRLREAEGRKRGPLLESFSEQERSELLKDLYEAAQEKQRNREYEDAKEFHSCWLLNLGSVVTGRVKALLLSVTLESL